MASEINGNTPIVKIVYQVRRVEELRDGYVNILLGFFQSISLVGNFRVVLVVKCFVCASIWAVIINVRTPALPVLLGKYLGWQRYHTSEMV